jgi:hypothetical protein
MTENDEDLREEVERLRAEVSQKGAVSLYGIRRFPITFYADEWDIILRMEDEIRTFIKENESELKRK